MVVAPWGDGGSPLHEGGAMVVAPWGDGGSPIPPPLPVTGVSNQPAGGKGRSQSPLGDQRSRLLRLGATEAEADEVIRDLKANPKIHSPMGILTKRGDDEAAESIELARARLDTETAFADHVSDREQSEGEW